MKHKRKREKRTQQVAARNLAPSLPERTLHRLAVTTLFILPLVFYFKYLFGGQMLFGTDWLGAGGYQMRLFMSEYIKHHWNIAFWMPALLSGQPTVAAFFGDLFYPTQFLRLFVPVHIVWAWTFYFHVAIAGLGTYLFLKELKLSVPSALLGGVAYMFAGSLLTLTYAGHDGRLIGCALMPMALYFLHLGMDRRRLLFFLLAGLMVALQLLSGHIQKVYYTGLILLAYFVYSLIVTVRKEHSAGTAIRLGLYFVIGMAFGVGLSAIQYLPIYGNMPLAARGSERGYEYATSWSMPIRETLDLLSPHVSGLLQDYHGSNPFKLHSEYMGLIPLILALVGIIRGWKKGTVRFFVVAFAVTLLMAWGGNTPFYRLPYLLLPGLSKFRGPGMIFFLASFSLAVLAGYGAERLREVVARRNVRSTPVLAILVAALMTLDIGITLRLWNPRTGFIRGVPTPEQYFAKDEAMRFLETDTSLYRVLPINYDRSDNGALMGHGIQSAGGQMPNPLQSFQDFIGSGRSVMFQAGNLANPNFMNLLSIKYVIGPVLPDDVSRYDAQTQQVIRRLRQFFDDPRLEPVFSGRQYAVYRNGEFVPRAFLVPRYRVMSGKEQLLDVLMRPTFDPAVTALLYDDPGFPSGTDSTVGTAQVVSYNANEIDVDVTASAQGLLVLSENWHPAWKAIVDGREAPVLRAYHTLRAVPVGPGTYKVVFRHDSIYYRLGSMLTLVSVLFLVGVIVVGAIRSRRRAGPVAD